MSCSRIPGVQAAVVNVELDRVILMQLVSISVSPSGSAIEIHDGFVDLHVQLRSAPVLPLIMELLVMSWVTN